MNTKNVSSFNDFHKPNLEIYYQFLLMSDRKFKVSCSYISIMMNNISQIKN